MPITHIPHQIIKTSELGTKYVRPSLTTIYQTRVGKRTLSIKDYITAGAYMAKNDPSYPKRSIAYRRTCVYELGKGKILQPYVKWRYYAYAVHGGVVTADIDKDRFTEVVFNDKDRGVTCLRADSGELKWIWPVKLVISKITLHDINRDGYIEAIFGNFPYVVCVLKHDGTILWSVIIYPSVGGFCSPLVYDIDSDGIVEIVCGGTRLVSCHPDGSIESLLTLDYPAGTICAEDTNMDGVVDVIIPGGPSDGVYCLRGDTFTPRFNIYTEGVASGSAISDIQLPYPSDIVFVEGNTVHDYCDLGEYYTYYIPWKYPPGAIYTPIVAVDDIDDDGMKEIVVGHRDGSLYCLYYTGSGLSIKWRFYTGYFVETSALIADIDSDEHKELIFAIGNGYFYILNNTGEVKHALIAGGQHTCYYNHLALSDIDDDGWLEIIIPGGTGGLVAIDG